LPVAALLVVWPAGAAGPQNTEERLEAARRFIRIQKPDRAMKELERVLQDEPENLEAWMLKGEVALRMADLDGALSYWTQASWIAPDDVDLLTRIADLLIRRKDRLDDALIVYGRILKLDPDNTRALLAMGSIYERKEEWDAASERYRRALSIDPNFVRARSNLGAVLFKTGRFEEAREELRKAIELSPNDLRSHVFLGLSQNHLGNYDLALSELKEALEIDPHSANRLLGVKEQLPQFHHLVEIFSQAYEESPLEAGRSYDLAVIYFYARDYDSAWEYLIRAERLRYPIPIVLKEVVYSKRRLQSQ